MKLKRATLKNYCQHADEERRFSDGILGIIGPNGSGKTNFVRAISDAIAGKFSKPKDRIIRSGEASGFVEIEFESATGDLVIVNRSLHGSEAFILEGEAKTKTCKTPSEVNARMAELFPVPPSVLKGVVFTPQEDITKLLFDPKSSVRERMALSFFGMEKAGQIEASLTEILTSFPDVVSSSNTSGLHSAKESLAQLVERLRGLDSEAAMLSGQIMSESDMNAEQLLVERYRLESRARSNRDNLVEAEEQIAGIRLEIEEVGTRAIGGNLADMQEKARLLQTEMEMRIRIDSDQARYLGIQARLEELGLLLDPEGEDAITLAATESHLQGIQSELDEVRQELALKQVVKAREILASASVRADTKGECLVCLRGDLTEDEAARMGKQQASDLQRVVQIEHLESSLEGQWQANVGEQRRLLDKRDRLLAERESLQVQAKACLRPSTGKTVDQISKELREIQSMLGGIEAIEEQMKGLRRRLKEANAIRTAAIEGGVNLGESPVTEDEVVRARAMIEESNNASSALRYCDSSIDAVVATIAATKLRIKEIRDSIKVARATAEKRRVLKAMRSIFHYSAAPKIVVNSRIRSISDRINNYLEILDVHYRVETKEGFDFDCIFGTGTNTKVLKPQDLSGGEKVDLSIAFRLAAAESFCSGVGFLVLDEPTVWLDAKTKDKMPFVMERLKDLSVSSGTQYILVTHEESLIPYFDQVISFSR